MKKIVVVVMALVFCIGSISWADSYLVKWKHQPKAGHAYKHILDGKLTRMELTEEQAEALLDNDDVEYVEEDGLAYLTMTPNDPSYNLLWGMTMVSAPEAWDITTGSSDVIVGVIDTGIDYTHPDLVDNVWVNPVDGSYGWNAIANTNDPMDDNHHGTHVSGTIAGVGNNGIGVVGINWSAKVMMCKAFNSGGSGAWSDIIECLDWFKGQRNNGVNVSILSNSWGGYGFYQAGYDAVASLSDWLFVAAAGNGATNIPHYPAAFDLPNVLSIAATNETDGLASFSNYDPVWVDMGAPGTNTYSTIISGYGYMSGTSMATPHVAGAAGLLLANDIYSVAELKSRLMDYGDPNEALAGKTVSGKRLNVYGSLVGSEPPPPPYCGDGTCDPTESCSTCPEDCGECPPPPINEPPIADFTYSPFKKQIRFTNLSTDPDGTIVEYRWDFGDGRTGGARNPKHVYHQSGDYSVTLTVTDNQGATGSITKPISVTVKKK